MAVTASGGLCKPLENMRTLLAACSAFQTWVGAANAAEAKAYINIFANEESELQRPGVVIFWSQENEWTANKVFGGAESTYERTGTADLYFTADRAISYTTFEDQVMDFCNDVGDILNDLLENAGTDNYIDIVAASKVGGPSISGKEEKNPLAQMVIRVTWWGK